MLGENGHKAHVNSHTFFWSVRQHLPPEEAFGKIPSVVWFSAFAVNKIGS